MKNYDKTRFCQTMLYNEALFGQSKEQLEMIMQEIGTTLPFEFHNFYICLTGIHKNNYQKYLNMDRVMFQTIYYPVRQSIDELAAQHHIEEDSTVINYDSSKQICFFIRTTSQSTMSVTRFAQEIMLRLESLYIEKTDYSKSKLANFTVLSAPIEDYESMAEAFENVRDWKRLAFFKMEALVMSPDGLVKPEPDWRDINTKVAMLKELMTDLNQHHLRIAVHDLFLRDLKEYASFKLCYSVLNDIKKIVLEMTEPFLLEAQNKYTEQLTLENYCCIEEMEEAISALLLELHEMAAKRQSKLSAITLNSINYIKSHYHQEIGLQDIADELKLAPAYLSRIFSKELNITLSAYMTKLRMERAKHALLDTNEKIATISKRVGIENTEYFSVMFKKNTGVSPQKYRQMFKQ